MPRVVSCSICHQLERMPDPPTGIPMVPARWEWEDDGQVREYVFKTDDGEVIMVPEYDQLLDDFVARHTHGRPDTDSIDYIKSFSVDQSTWERVDVVTQVKKELSEATGEQFAESEYYKEEALKCYNAHGNPDLKSPCIDVFTEEKKIGRTKGIPDSQAMYLCHMCLTGDTLVVTRDGIRPIADLAAEGGAEVLRPSKNGFPTWEWVPVRSYGIAPVYEVSLYRGRETKTIRATADHRWSSGGDFLATSELTPGTHLDSSYAYPVTGGNAPRLSPQGVQHGIVYGDGTLGTGNRPATVKLFGDDKADLLKWFPGNFVKELNLPDEYTQDTVPEVRDLPRSFKSAPSLRESRSYLLGFLAGYFAADGSVSDNGQAVIESASYQSMLLVSGICHSLGIGVGGIRERMRKGIRSEAPTTLYRMTIRAADLPDEFWLREFHALRREGRGAKAMPDWRVKSVSVESVSTEEVFCAEVPEVERFVLEGNLVTGNCPYVQAHVVSHIRDVRKLYDPKAVKATMSKIAQQKRKAKK